MKWLENFTLVMRSHVTALREKVEDPERMLHQLIVDMEDDLEATRQSVAEAIADEILLGKQAESARKQAEVWEDRARQSLERGDEASARAAVDCKLRAEERADGLDVEHAKQKEQTSALQESFRDLEDKIRQAKQKRTLLLARMARANSTNRINRALDRADSRSALAQFSRMEDRVERNEALGEAYDRLQGRDPECDRLAKQFAAEERKTKLEKELNTLKERLGETGAE